MMIGLSIGPLLVPAAGAEEESAYVRSGWFVGISGGVALERFGDEYRKGKYLKASGDGILSRVGRGPRSATGDKDKIEPPSSDSNATPDFISLSVDPRVSFNFHAGYRINPRWAVEAQFEVVDEFDVAVKENIPFRDISAEGPLPTRTIVRETSTALRIRPIVATGNVKAYLSKGRIQPFLSLGAGAAWINHKNERSGLKKKNLDFVMRFGGGVEFYVTDHVLMTSGVSYVYPTGSMQDRADYLSVEALGFQYRFGGD